MNFDLSEDQNMLRDQAARLMAEKASPGRLRDLLDEGAAYDPDLWSALAELGFLGSVVPEEFGGLGMAPLDLAMLVEEAGRACAPIPLFSSICLAAEAIAIAGTAEQKARILPSLADGSRIATFAHVEGPGPVLTADVRAILSDGQLTGTKFPVPDGMIADISVVVVRSGDATALALVELGGGGVTRAMVPGIDHLRQHARIGFDGAAAELMCEGAAAETALAAIYDRAAVYAAFEQLGGAERCLFMARDYVLDRKIFSRPLGSYQAVKHRLADMLCLVEVARSNAWFAAWALVNDPEAAPAAVATARISATEAFECASRENLQLHGGIGYTWEADCHFYYRRSRLLTAALGPVSEWARRLLDRISVPARAN